ncbi:hypothetical protein GCM10010168_85770 [Actinoplanes ianthinogenes]|uniref:Uncharacterized protein n=1 Tax=Actinoplanes ianthinogenes TaxID=122358 RepID=A0ABM7M150_9ACTN|nr:hypothetical protein [Actinoplanes ianthinogenes]BCJ45308.1 hypothetical protein Aiant_59650 [Actinoplanes ianthinogenes]GGR53692.1 hypothetical protein GCM10010168_85770 [Actinoplanes ianthinogenes]
MSTPRTSRRRRGRPSGWTLFKDVSLYLGGWGLIWHQALIVRPADFNLTLTLVGAALIGVPGASQLLAARTGGSPSPDPPEGSEPSPLSSPSGSGADR